MDEASSRQILALETWVYMAMSRVFVRCSQIVDIHQPNTLRCGVVSVSCSSNSLLQLDMCVSCAGYSCISSVCGLSLRVSNVLDI